ncbi:hypothetical protein ACDF64_09675 [Agromyces sp. MMS24-JH15]|uniref:hypothetical protein n=1 Tax=Agromyces sp. MMS24-JH15 TaxID=3243765 RepID=UPI0037492BFD
MRTTAGRLVFDAVDHEIVRLHEQADAPHSGFADAYVATAPIWRLVSGYLMIAGTGPEEPDAAPARLDVHSHGRRVGWLSADGDVIRVASDRRFAVVDGTIRGDGVALVPGESTDWSLAGGGCEVEVPRAPGWSLTIVHGPAPVKVENRLRLLASLDRVGGRRG